jgi:hypothetical protein
LPVAQPTEIGLRHGLTAPCWALLIVLLAVGGAACGNSSSTGSHAAVPVAFQRKALAVCKAAAAQKKAEGPFPYPKFNPTRPDWSKFPGVADALIKTPQIFRTWQRNMQALGEPSTGRAAWDDLLAAIDSHVRIASEQQAAAARRDSQTFIKDYDEGANTQEELLRAANAAGVAGCAAVDR